MSDTTMIAIGAAVLAVALVAYLISVMYRAYADNPMPELTPKDVADLTTLQVYEDKFVPDAESEDNFGVSQLTLREKYEAERSERIRLENLTNRRPVGRPRKQ